MTSRKEVIFTLASARSGTLYLSGLFRRNVRDCACRHEPFFDWGNPTLFGPAIYDAWAGRVDRVRERLLRKREYIGRLPQRVYLESSHAFLKSAYVAALDVFPDLKLIHLIRDPLLVAKSESVRMEWRRRVRAPFHFYRGDDGRRHFCWALTGNEEIFRHFEGETLSPFQWCLVQWIEIENRAMRFLAEHGLEDRCFTLRTPRDLNDAAVLREMFDFFGLETVSAEFIPGGRRNRGIRRRTVITSDDEREWREVLDRLPEGYLEVFRDRRYGGVPRIADDVCEMGSGVQAGKV